MFAIYWANEIIAQTDAEIPSVLQTKLMEVVLSVMWVEIDECRNSFTE